MIKFFWLNRQTQIDFLIKILRVKQVIIFLTIYWNKLSLNVKEIWSSPSHFFILIVDVLYSLCFGFFSLLILYFLLTIISIVYLFFTWVIWGSRILANDKKGAIESLQGNLISTEGLKHVVQSGRARLPVFRLLLAWVVGQHMFSPEHFTLVQDWCFSSYHILISRIKTPISKVSKEKPTLLSSKSNFHSLP